MEILRTEKIAKSYQSREIIRDISLRLEEGELVSLLGLSGSGKTTLLNILAGLVRPEEGQVFLCGQDITGAPGHVSYMLQKDLLLEHKRVIDNVALPLVIAGMGKKEAREKADPYFARFDLEGTQMLYPSQMSGGMRQRAALLRTYLSSRGVILLDEPFSALDMITREQLHAWYLDIMAEMKLSTILITHDADEAIKLSDRIYILAGSPGEIRHEFRIDVPRDERKEFNVTPEFAAWKRQIRDALRESAE
jgi:ABC-type nitrate/sulfonate/bicarbonate transport system ATPase subunit